VFRHCPTSGGGGTSPVVDERVDEGAVRDRVGVAAAGELASFPQAAVPPTPMTTTRIRVAERWKMAMGLPFSTWC
jgi:hypothetical protein